MFKPGDLIFIKEGRKSSQKNSIGVKFKGTAFCVLLGVVPRSAPDPKNSDILRLLGTIGLVSFDDVANFLGDESGAKCVKMFEEKYYPQVAEVSDAPVQKEESKIVLLPTRKKDIH